MMSHMDTGAADESSQVFFGRLQKGIFVLGLELGFLLQGSTVPIQHFALNFVPDTSTQLFLSLIWGYMLATVGLYLFFHCQRLVRALLHLEANDDDSYEKELLLKNTASKELQDDNHHFHYLVDLQCQFAQGSVIGVFLSWLFVDRLLNYQTRVLYGGIMFLVSLLYFLRQIWNSHGCMEWAESQLELAMSSSLESESESSQPIAGSQVLHLL